MIVAILEQKEFNIWRVVKVPEGKGWKSIEERGWLHELDYLGPGWHLVQFATVEGK